MCTPCHEWECDVNIYILFFLPTHHHNTLPLYIISSYYPCGKEWMQLNYYILYNICKILGFLENKYFISCELDAYMYVYKLYFCTL